MSRKPQHWTERSSEDFVYSIASDFVEAMVDALKANRISQAEFASMLGVSEGRVSQVISNPGNLRLTSIVKWTRALKMKVSIVAYDDGDAENVDGPVFAGVFRRAWEALGRPRSEDDLDRVRIEGSRVRWSELIDASPMVDEESKTEAPCAEAQSFPLAA